MNDNNTEAAEPEPSAGERTLSRTLTAAVNIARSDGIEQVTHRTVAAAVDLSPSNVKYHLGGSDEMRRAVALQIIDDASEMPHWYNFTLHVRGLLPDGHRWTLTGTDVEGSSSPADLQLVEAMSWLARNSATA